MNIMLVVAFMVSLALIVSAVYFGADAWRKKKEVEKIMEMEEMFGRNKKEKVEPIEAEGSKVNSGFVDEGTLQMTQGRIITASAMYSSGQVFYGSSSYIAPYSDFRGGGFIQPLRPWLPPNPLPPIPKETVLQEFPNRQKKKKQELTQEEKERLLIF